jgi:hypothetical protein
MLPQPYYTPDIYRIPEVIIAAIEKAAKLMAEQSARSFRIHANRRGRAHKTLRPGRKTPLWNQLRRQLRPHLRRYGDQVNLGRMLGLPRQRINAFVTGGGQMPDAERTLQLLVWLTAVRARRRPS